MGDCVLLQTSYNNHCQSENEKYRSSPGENKWYFEDLNIAGRDWEKLLLDTRWDVANRRNLKGVGGGSGLWVTF